MGTRNTPRIGFGSTPVLPQSIRLSGVSNFVDPQGFPTQARPRPASDSILKAVRCSARTDLCFRSSRELRVCEFLALHHCLDPDALRLHGRDPYEFAFQLKDELQDDPGNEVRYFLEDFDFFCLAVVSRELRCIRVNRRDPLQSTTTAQHFYDFLCAHDVIRTYPRVTEVSEGSWLYFPHVTPALRTLQRIAFLWETTDRNGQYRPGDMGTAPDLKDIATRFNLPKRQAEVMPAIVRPLSARAGRRPKPSSPALPNMVIEALFNLKK